jgi:nifR3 family TIM-barrel protein
MKNKNFWKQLKKPIFCLAPMANVTDVAFRAMFAKYGGPDVFWTEFVSVDGLFGGGYDALIHDLEFSEKERPIVAQFFSPRPELMKKAAELAVQLGFDGIDINMGCPDKNVCKQGSGAALIKTPELAREIIRATKDGAGDLPVSVKTRIGYNKIEIESWLPELLAEDPAVVILHARTKKQMSKVDADWSYVKRGVEIRNELNSDCLIVGNGDVSSLDDGEKRAKETGADGIMVGRGIFGNPWFFNREVKVENLSIEDRLKVMLEHTLLFEQKLGGVKNFAIMRKHYKAYIKGFPQAKKLITQLMEAQDYSEVKGIVEAYIDDIM